MKWRRKKRKICETRREPSGSERSTRRVGGIQEGEVGMIKNEEGGDRESPPSSVFLGHPTPFLFAGLIWSCYCSQSRRREKPQGKDGQMVPLPSGVRWRQRKDRSQTDGLLQSLHGGQSWKCSCAFGCTKHSQRDPPRPLPPTSTHTASAVEQEVCYPETHIHMQILPAFAVFYCTSENEQHIE